MHLIERTPEHYDELEVDEIGHLYRWCPECVVLECDSCGKRTTLKRSELISSGFECECGKDNAASVREEVVLQLVGEEYEARHHPWRYWDTSEETAGIPTSKTSTPLWESEHSGLMIVDHVQGGYVSQCLRCEMWGPIGKTPEKACQLLIQQLAVTLQQYAS